MDMGRGDKDLKLAFQFVDLLTKMLTLDPNKRMTVVEALNHPFILSR
jgi:serine/threonine protein kinase